MEVPGLDDIAGLLEPNPLDETRAFDPISKLGRKGLLFKDQATKLGLCAVTAALTRAALPLRDLHATARTGVVVSSNLGNVDTVCRVIDTVYAGSAADLSPMDVPNASSNVIASSIAIRFGCRAVNLMLCNGATSGTDALFLAANALRMRRAERMIVVGVEPQNEFVRQLVAASLPAGSDTPTSVRLAEGAACVILEMEPTARARRATVYGVLDGYAYSRHETRPLSARGNAPARPDFWLTPNQAWPSMKALGEQRRELWDANVPHCDISLGVGELYGALGVFQCVAACHWLGGQAVTGGNAGASSVLATAGGSWGDGIASMTINRYTA